jgi:murein DD-endopeptidase MepM/ murein hydrolase activator NlpD
MAGAKNVAEVVRAGIQPVADELGLMIWDVEFVKEGAKRILRVTIDHENGIETYYAHNSALLVSRGDRVFQGQHIAEAGNTGNSFGSHIHFGVKDNGTFQNPRNYLPAR